MSESSNGPVQLSFLVQVEKAACVTFPLCAVKVTHWHWCSVLKIAGWRSKRTYRVKTQASVAIFCDPVFAEVCTGKRTNRPDNRRFFQVVKRRALSTTAWSRREIMPEPLAQKEKTVFASKRFFASLNCRASLAFSRSSDSKAIRRSGETI
ncbi:hypothetical protein [Enterobacter hormaechei]|uniref:hypothetical protein n=1 Tax=Enterobacter hormaechei TaxID=158836 RepID=UPI002A464869|nr:hypothetical protein [Enterobacter hormaechei subsp. oharae]